MKKILVVVGTILLVLVGVPFAYLHFRNSGSDRLPERPRQPEQFTIPGNRFAPILEEPAGTPKFSGGLPDYHDGTIDHRLVERLRTNGVKPLSAPSEHGRKKVRLGRWLFWEKELSGNRDLSCGICHNPTAATTDHLSLSIGPNARGGSVARDVRHFDDFMARNALDLFNRGQSEWHRLFWDGRVARQKDGTLRAPLPEDVTKKFDTVLQLLVTIPPVRNDELRGEPGERDLFGQENRIANLPDTAFVKIWDRYLARLTDYPEYNRYFRDLYSSVDEPEHVQYTHVGDALAAFVETAYTLRNSPWDRYLAGQKDALSKDAKEGALLFYGRARCSECHSGKLMTDQKFYNIGVPQLGPGREPHEPFDRGAFSVTGRDEDRFAFRTPPLRNVSLTGPWMHNGAYKSLEGAVRHHMNPGEALRNYDNEQLGRDIQRYHRSPNWKGQLEQFPMAPPGTRLIPSVREDPDDHEKILRTLTPKLRDPIELNGGEFDRLMEFLFALTSPTLVEEPYRDRNGRDVNLIQLERRRTARMTTYNQSVVPDTTPSGIPVECLASWCTREND